MILPGAIVGKDGGDYGLLLKQSGIDDEKARIATELHRALRWLPAAAEDRRARVIGAYPTANGTMLLRVSQGGADSHGRGLIVQLECLWVGGEPIDAAAASRSVWPTATLTEGTVIEADMTVFKHKDGASGLPLNKLWLDRPDLMTYSGGADGTGAPRQGSKTANGGSQGSSSWGQGAHQARARLTRLWPIFFLLVVCILASGATVAWLKNQEIATWIRVGRDTVGEREPGRTTSAIREVLDERDSWRRVLIEALGSTSPDAARVSIEALRSRLDQWGTAIPSCSTPEGLREHVSSLEKQRDRLKGLTGAPESELSKAVENLETTIGNKDREIADLKDRLKKISDLTKIDDRR